MKLISLERILNRMKISTKIILSNIFFLIPMGIMLFISLTGINYDIRFSSLELYGNEYQRPLESLLQYIPDYMRLSLRPERQSELSDLESRIDSAFRDLAEVQKSRGMDLQFTPDGLSIHGREQLVPSLMKARWDDIKKNRSWADYNSLVSDVREMITHAGDTSNLILDPDLDSYYLMDLTLLVLPQTQDRLGEVLLFGFETLTALEKSGLTGLSKDEQLQFYVYAKMLEESDYGRIEGSTETAVNEDQNFYGLYQPVHDIIPAAFEEYSKPTLDFIAMLYDLGSSETVNFTTDEFIRLGEQARGESFSYWHNAVDILDDLLEIRIDSYRRQFFKYLAAAVATTLFV